MRCGEDGNTASARMPRGAGLQFQARGEVRHDSRAVAVQIRAGSSGTPQLYLRVRVDRLLEAASRFPYAGRPLCDPEPEADRTRILQQRAAHGRQRGKSASALRERCDDAGVVPGQQGACFLRLQHQHRVGHILAGRAAVQIVRCGAFEPRAQRLQQRNCQRARESHGLCEGRKLDRQGIAGDRDGRRGLRTDDSSRSLSVSQGGLEGEGVTQGRGVVKYGQHLVGCRRACAQQGGPAHSAKNTVSPVPCNTTSNHQPPSRRTAISVSRRAAGTHLRMGSASFSTQSAK
jgi:hypothetical protein